MSQALEGKTALVTGGSRGIGKAIGEKLAAAGASVVINYTRNEQLAHEVVRAISAKGGRAVAIQADVSKTVEVQRLFRDAEKALGGLDIVIANAGVHIVKPLIENTEADYDYIFDTNTRGVFFTLQEAGRRVRDVSPMAPFVPRSGASWRDPFAMYTDLRDHDSWWRFRFLVNGVVECLAD